MRPEDQPVMGLAEVAKFIGVSKQAITNWRKRRDFPKPIAELHAGPLWATDAIVNFKATPRPPRRVVNQCWSEEQRAEARERLAKVNFIHGHARHGMRSATYRSWAAMLSRCCNRKNSGWKRYGGANPPVKVCARWDPAQGGSFLNFFHDKGPRPAGTSIGRLRDLGDYTPSNCRWMTRAEQEGERKKKKALTRRILARGLWTLRRWQPSSERNV